MNVVALILAIVVIILFYMLYRFFMLKSTELTSTASLLDSNPVIDIKNNPTSTRYTYGIWIYVNSWDASQSKTIFERANNIKLYFADAAPILKCDITMNGSTVAAPVTSTIEITDNFPIQKWVHIVTSVDNQYLDAYLDGKLVKSGRMHTAGVAGVAATANTSAVSEITESAPKTPGTEGMVIGGGTTFDAYIAKFNHWTSPLDPQTVWSTYNEGNGQSSMNNYISSYGIDLSILRDNVEQSKYSIF
jgi:hypothetical protein